MQLVLRNSELSTWRSCRQKWQWAYRDLLQPKRNAVPLRFGDLVHRALAAYYIPGTKRGPGPAFTFSKLYSAQLEEFGEMGMYVNDSEEEVKWENALELGMTMLRGYVDLYGKDERYKVISPEMPFQVDVYDDEGNFICTFVGTIDAVVIDLYTELCWLLEHKTAASIRTDHLTLDEQAGTYWLFAPIVLEAMGLPKLEGIMYNFLRKAGPDERPTNYAGQHLNKDGSVSKRQPPPLFLRFPVRRTEREAESVLHRIANQAVEIEWVDKGEMTVYKNPSLECRFCQFREMCELHESGQDWEEFRDLTMKKWSPYEIHEGYLLSESGT